MIEFMVISLPRSGSSWAAVWLEAVHDPLWTAHYSDWDSRGWQGVSCTGIHRWPAWLNAHPARKLILHRPKWEREVSLKRMNIPTIGTLPPDSALDGIEGLHAIWSDIFDINKAPTLWRFLRKDKPFDPERHIRLTEMAIQPYQSKVHRDHKVYERLMAELRLRGPHSGDRS